MAEIKDLAPTLLTALSADELKHAFRPKDPPKPVVPQMPPLQPKRHRQLVALLAKGVEFEVACKEAYIPPDYQPIFRAEVEAVKELLKDLPPVAAEAPMEVTPVEEPIVEPVEEPPVGEGPFGDTEPLVGP